MTFNYNWDQLDQAVNTKRACYPFEAVEHLFRKVAFDVYKPLNGSDRLWELRDGEDGGKYLFALYEEAEDLTVQSEKTATASAVSWDAISDKDGKNITLSYKNFPLLRFAADQFKFAPEEAQEFAEFIKAKTADKNFVDGLLTKMPEAKRQVLKTLLNQ